MYMYKRNIVLIIRADFSDATQFVHLEFKTSCLYIIIYQLVYIDVI